MVSQPPPPAASSDVAASAVDTRSSIHIFFNPHSARGHTIPLVEMARLFAQRPGVCCTVVTTPGNSSYILPTIDEAKASGHCLDLLLLQPFPYAVVGLPPGVECTDALPPGHINQQKLGVGLFLLRDRFRDLVAEHRPDCIVSDNLMFWNADVARSLSVPYFVFSVLPAFSKAVIDNVVTVMNNKPKSTTCDHAEGGMIIPLTGLPPTDGGHSESWLTGLPPDRDHLSGVMIPLTGLPHPLEFLRAELPIFIRSPAWLQMVTENERKSCGIIFNTVYELESEYVDHYAGTNLTGTTMKVWCVGPVQLYKSYTTTNGYFGQDHGWIKDWLDSKEPESVLYISFGSECHFTPEQLREIAVGLQVCQHCFIWVVRRGGGGGDTIKEWLPQEFHETVGDRGLILTDWAPQVAILNHRATGGYVLHCGWSSTLEAVWAGLPVIAWPQHSEQFINERFVVEVLGIGLRILDGAEMRSVDAELKGVVKGEVIRDAVDRLMGGGDEEVRAMRANATKYQEFARSATDEGGSSYVNVSSVIELIKEKKKEKINMNTGVEADGIGVRSVHAVVTGEVIREAVDLLMGRGDEEAVRSMRMKANKYLELLGSAIEKGGSSSVNLRSVIELFKEKEEKRTIVAEAEM